MKNYPEVEQSHYGAGNLKLKIKPILTKSP